MWFLECCVFAERDARGKPKGPYISEKGCVSDFHYGLVYEHIAVENAMTIPDAKAAVDKAR